MDYLDGVYGLPSWTGCIAWMDGLDEVPGWTGWIALMQCLDALHGWTGCIALMEWLDCLDKSPVLQERRPPVGRTFFVDGLRFYIRCVFVKHACFANSGDTFMICGCRFVNIRVGKHCKIDAKRSRPCVSFESG